MITSKMPTTGQFVAVWYFGGVPWSRTFEWDDKTLMYYDDEEDVFVPFYSPEVFHYDAIFII